MLRLASAFGLPLLIVVVFVLAEQVAPRTDALAIPEEPSEQARILAPSLPEEAPVVTEQDSLPGFTADAIDPWDHTPFVGEARRLLDGLGACADSGVAVIPGGEIDALRDLLARRPELADLVIEARKAGSQRLRAFLTLAIYGIDDPVTEKRLIAACKADDPACERVKEILADTALVVAVLRDAGDPELRYELLGRMRKPLIEDERVFAELREIIDTESAPKIAARAVKRLAKSGKDGVTGTLLTILTDTGRSLETRRAAASALMRRPGRETTEALLSIVENRGEDSLLRLAAQGLRNSWENPRAREALLALLADEKADGEARKSAVNALVYCFRQLPAEEGESLETRICEHLSTLASRRGSEAVVVSGLSGLSRAVGEPLRGSLLSIYEGEANEEVRQLFRADPALNRYLETR